MGDIEQLAKELIELHNGKVTCLNCKREFDIDDTYFHWQTGVRTCKNCIKVDPNNTATH